MLIERTWRVTMADVDAAGIIYYASPMRWSEGLLGDWLRQALERGPDGLSEDATVTERGER